MNIARAAIAAVVTTVALAVPAIAGAHVSERMPLIALHSQQQIHARYDQAVSEQLMLVAAADYWHQLPACGMPVLVRVDSVPANVQPDSWAYTYVDAGAEQTCDILIVDNDWTAHNESTMFNQLCRVVAHEYSHLLGYPDEDAPGTLLDHYVEPTVSDEYCDGAWQFAGIG